MPFFGSTSLKARFAISSVLMVVLSALLAASLVSDFASRQVRDDAGRFLAESAFQVSDKLDREMWHSAKELELLAKLDVFSADEGQRQAQVVIDQLHKASPAFAWIGFTNDEGLVLAASNGVLLGQSIAHRPVFLGGRNKLFVGDVHEALMLADLLPNPTGEQMKFVDLSVPVLAADGTRRGILAAHLSWAWVSGIDQDFIQPLLQKQHIELFVVSQDGMVLLGPPGTAGTRLDLPGMGCAPGEDAFWRLQSWPDGHEYLTGAAKTDGYRDYPGLGWTVLARQPLDVAFKPVERMKTGVLALGAAFAGFVAIIGVGVAGIISRPLSQIVDCARRLQCGEQVQFPRFKGNPDIEELSAALRDMVQSLTRVRAERDDMKDLAHADMLTGLPNRLAVEKYLDKLAGMPLRKGQAVGLLFMDLDGFKRVNDTLGHEAGDFVLKTVGMRLTGCLRSNDVAARFGGDEFVVVAALEQALWREQTTTLAKRFLQAVSNSIYINGEAAHVGLSIGASVYLGDGRTPRQVLKEADDALYSAKLSGKNRLVFYEPDMEPSKADSAA